MAWNRKHIDAVALSGAAADHAAFEAIGLSELHDASILDVGCFDGFNTVLKFKPYGNIARVVGIDPDADSIALAKRATDDPRFSWNISDAETFDGDGECFDVVYYSHVFQHVEDKVKSLANTMRMLKPGGFVIIKTIDDTLMMSHPDPEGIVKQIACLYDKSVRPFKRHTSFTDRYIGSKCYSLLVDAGFESVYIRVMYTDTAGKKMHEKLSLFERVTYYRCNVPAEGGVKAQRAMDNLMAQWREMFLRDDYYFAMPTVLAIARKPSGTAFDGYDSYGLSETGDERNCRGRRISLWHGDWLVRAMRESHLGAVMAIEIESFPDPWTPVAYASEIRHNGQARYVVAIDRAGEVKAYAGWWLMPEDAVIMRIAVSRDARRKGVGKLLVQCAIRDAVENGKRSVKLTVRQSNMGAHAFYKAMGFEAIGLAERYYTNPDETGIVMFNRLAGEKTDSE